MNDASFADLEAGVRRAEEHIGAGRFGDALAAYHKLLAGRLAATRRDASPLVAADLVIVERLAELSVLFGEHEAADELLAGMAGLNREAGNLYGADWATLKRLHLALGRGELRHADELLRGLAPTIGDVEAIDFSPAGLEHWEASCRWPGADPGHREVLFPALYLAMGELLAALGQYGEARAAVEAGLGHTGASKLELAQQIALPLRLTRAAVLLESGCLEDAGRELDGLADELDAGQHPGFAARRLELAGKLGMLRGRYAVARECFEEVLRLCTNGGFAAARRTAALNLAHALVLLNHTHQAEGLLRDALEEARAVGHSPVAVRAELLLPIARARGESLANAVAIAPAVKEMWDSHHPRRDPSAAGETATPVLDLPQAGSYLAWFEDRALAFHYFLSRDLAVAGELGEQMDAVFHHTDSFLIHVRLAVMRALLAYYRGNAAAAEHELRAAHDACTEMGLVPELYEVRRYLGWCWAKLGRSEKERQELARDTEALLNQLAGSLSGADRAVYLLNKWTVEEEALAGKTDALVALRKRRESSGWARRLGLRFQELRRLDELLVHLDGHHRRLAESVVEHRTAAPEVLDRPGLLRRLFSSPRHRVALVFLVLPDRVLIMRCGRRQLDFGVSPVTRIQVREIVGRWHELMRATAGARDIVLAGAPPLPANAAERARKLAAELAAALQLPSILATLPAHVTALRLVLDDSLHGFPFAAMVHDGQYLAERWALSIAPESAELQAPPRPASSEALLVAVSRGASEHRLAPLPGVLRELDRISAWCDRSPLAARQLVDGAASKAAVSARLPRSALWHVACHGLFEPDRPDASGLVLVPGDGDETEILSLRDLVGLDLAALRHATLSSCWSADNFVMPGRYVLSLPEILCRAGVGSVLSSLWPVDDEVAVELMERFYGYLAESPRDVALKRVQQECLGEKLKTTADVADPYFWAGLRLYGDPGRLKI